MESTPADDLAECISKISWADIAIINNIVVNHYHLDESACGCRPRATTDIIVVVITIVVIIVSSSSSSSRIGSDAEGCYTTDVVFHHLCYILRDLYSREPVNDTGRRRDDALLLLHGYARVSAACLDIRCPAGYVMINTFSEITTYFVKRFFIFFKKNIFTFENNDNNK